MRFLLIIITLLGLTNIAFSGYELDRFELARQAHMEKKFTDAIDLLEKEIEVQPNNPSLYFNLGLAYKAEKMYPKAIWAFEKTLKFQPKDSESIQLIETCYTEMDSDLLWKDETGTFQRTLIALGSNFWAFLAISLSLLAAIGIIMTKRTRKNGNRKWYIGTAVFSIITMIVCVSNAASSYNYENNDDFAIVLDNVEIAEGTISEKVVTSQFKVGSKIKVLKWHKDGSASIQTVGKTVKITKGLARI